MSHTLHQQFLVPMGFFACNLAIEMPRLGLAGLIRRFLQRHHVKVRSYWSTSLTTVRGGALSPGVVDNRFELLQTAVTTCAIYQDCIFSMDETCCFLDKCTRRTRHIDAADARTATDGIKK